MTQECTIRELSTAKLMKYHKPEEIFGNCQNCSRYNKNWSCPPRSFDIEKFVTIYAHSYIIAVKFSLKEYETKEESIASYYAYRKEINNQLLKNEAEFTTLFAGHCELCEECTKVDDLECRKPDSVRYSLESLGFKVSDIMEELFDESLQWTGTTDPDSLFIVAAILTDREFSDEELKRVAVQENCDQKSYCSCA